MDLEKNEIKSLIEKSSLKKTSQDFNFNNFIIKEENLILNFKDIDYYRDYDDFVGCVYEMTIIDDKGKNLSFYLSDLDSIKKQIFSIDEFKENFVENSLPSNGMLHSQIFKKNSSTLNDITEMITRGYQRPFRDRKFDEKILISELNRIEVLKKDFDLNEFKTFAVMVSSVKENDENDNGRISSSEEKTFLLVDKNNNRICFDIDQEFRRQKNYVQFKKPSSKIVEEILNEQADKPIQKEEECVKLFVRQERNNDFLK